VARQRGQRGANGCHHRAAGTEGYPGEVRLNQTESGVFVNPRGIQNLAGALPARGEAPGSHPGPSALGPTSPAVQEPEMQRFQCRH
jgi:hypothetical protein